MWLLISAILFVLAYLSYKSSHSAKKKKEENDRFSSTASETLVTSRRTYGAITEEASDVTKPAYKFHEEMNGYVLAYQYHDVGVAVFDKSEVSIDSIKVGDMVFLQQEKDNPYDPRAVKITLSGKRIGYLYRGKLQDMANDWIDKGIEVWSYVSQVDKANNKIQIAIGFYKEGEYLSLKNSGAEYKTYRLTGNRNEEMQSNIATCSVGDEVSFDYDYEKDKYMVSTAWDIGFLPASANKYSEDYKSAYIDSIDIDDNDKYVVTVAVFPNN